MQIVHADASLVDAVRSLPRPLALVPMSMNLHAGHQACIRHACAENASVAVSMWLTARPGDCVGDHVHTPDSPEADAEAARAAGANLLFCDRWFPSCPSVRLTVRGLAERWEGARFPSMFPEAMASVLRIVLAVRPDTVYFGEKDFQQLQVMRRMIDELLPGITVIASPTARDCDGLALSSSNRRLAPEHRLTATALHRAIERAQYLVAEGVVHASALQRAMLGVMSTAGIYPDYAVVVDPETLAPIKNVEREARALVAGYAGDVRLIDNGPLTPLAPKGER